MALTAVKKHTRSTLPQGRRNMGLPIFIWLKHPCDGQGGRTCHLCYSPSVCQGRELRVKYRPVSLQAGPHDGCTLPVATNNSQAVLPSGLQHWCANNIVIYPRVEKNFPSISLSPHRYPTALLLEPPECVASARVRKYKTSLDASRFLPPSLPDYNQLQL